MTMDNESDAKRAIVVVNYGSHRLLEANLGRLPPNGGVRIIVVDNFSTNEELEAVRWLAERHKWTLVPLPDNKGFGAAMNRGVREGIRLGCESFLLLNPDAVAERTVIDELHLHCERQRMDLVSPLICDSAGTLVFRGSEVEVATGQMRGLQWVRPAVRLDALSRALELEPEVDGWHRWLTAACLAMHRELFEKMGGFNESYFLYWEDVDLSIRAASQGASLVLRRDLIALHDEGGTQTSQRGRAKSSRYYFYNCRNRLLFATGHLPALAILGWMARTPAQSWAILRRGGRRQLLESPRPLLATIGGSFAGLAFAVQALLCTGVGVTRSVEHDLKRGTVGVGR